MIHNQVKNPGQNVSSGQSKTSSLTTIKLDSGLKTQTDAAYLQLIHLYSARAILKINKRQAYNIHVKNKELTEFKKMVQLFIEKNKKKNF